jgi:hypothetical protein
VKRRLIAVLLAMFAFTGVGAIVPTTVAQAITTHYVTNRDNIHHYVLLRNPSTGLRYWKGLSQGVTSVRGAEGIAIDSRARMKLSVIATGYTYWSGCGWDYRDYGYVWGGVYYIPVTRSLTILDTVYAPSYPAHVC